MSDRFRTTCSSLAAALLLASLTLACSKKDDDAAAAAGASNADDSPAASAAASGNEGSIHLEVSGGPHAGTYDVTMPDGGCSYGLSGAGSWGNQYSVDTKDAKQFSSLQMIVPDTKAAAAGTSVFRLTAGFGPMMGAEAASYDVNTTSMGTKHGSGKVTVADHGKTGTVNFDAKTAEGVALKGTIDCRSVMRSE